MKILSEPINGEEFILPKRIRDFQKEVLDMPHSIADSFISYD